ncbi:MAG: MarR family transcriptional regulator [Anaerolineae bacterium]
MTSTPKKYYQIAQEGRLIGALLRVPYLAVVDGTYNGLRDAGFDDLTHAHLTVFQHIDSRKGSRLIDLAESAQITKQSMGYLIDYLESQGYVERVPDERDGRARLIRLTARGQALHATALNLVRDVEVRWRAHLGSERMDNLLDALKDLTTLIEGK